MTRMYQPATAGVPGPVTDVNLVDDYHHVSALSTDTLPASQLLVVGGLKRLVVGGRRCQSTDTPVISKFLPAVIDSAAGRTDSTAAVLAHYDTAGRRKYSLAHAR